MEKIEPTGRPASIRSPLRSSSGCGCILKRTTLCSVATSHLALKHYLDYRTTHVIDAWWAMESTTNSQRLALDRLRAIVKTVAGEHGYTFTERTTRSMTSREMQCDGRTIFSVQVADRAIELATPVDEHWHPVRIESLRNNIASKLTALVDRGAPRDFTDVHAVVAADIVSSSFSVAAVTSGL